MTKPIVVYTHGGPNPWKVVMVLEELGLPYEMRLVAHDEVKKEPYLKINPNGRTPAIVDPNGSADLVLWESGAILEYLVETYDAERRHISFAAGTPERWHAQQFLHFQTSGQGPYFGQTTWFRKFHGEDVPSAKRRYDEQLVRVVGVLDGLLAGKTYLVGEKCSYADIAFIPWNNMFSFIFGDEAATLVPESKYPNFYAWHKRLLERPAVQAALAHQAKAKAH